VSEATKLYAGERPAWSDIERLALTDNLVAQCLTALRAGHFETREETLTGCVLLLAKCRDRLMADLLAIQFERLTSPQTFAVPAEVLAGDPSGGSVAQAELIQGQWDRILDTLAPPIPRA
jgi:cytochrome P450